jgi:hypothetical protein
VQRQGAIAEERSRPCSSRGVFVRVRCCEGIGGDVAILAGQVTNLAGLGECGVARRSLESTLDLCTVVKLNDTRLATLKRVDMG